MVVLTTGDCSTLPDGWVAFGFAMILLLIATMLSLVWKYKNEQLEKQIKEMVKNGKHIQ